ncbi:Nucleoside-diphosphate-sugar epimerase [Nakamurella panacisegetis]|uniref:Nucleoside-diphosphate-sugar epimerase n=1 Tax=Nakamurella panacisegetis TaxID=1090615 RepID=A0A1H0RBQ2_9ACTN|nr:NAD-dependent epimerase/dehydratase family protein [Nakamurella panacisegetis]SDP26963.1 Nucleoside-diphosphate-sugar epimerase [Nakamurella panacisegetis]
MAHVFVTGGSGFIGQVLIRRLVDNGHDVRALVRSETAAATVAALGATPVPGVLTEPDTWRDAVSGSQVLFHLAAETNLDADLARHRLVTVDGTRAALEVAREAKVPRFVNCGSEAALLAGDPLVDLDETAPLRPDSPAPYCAAKAQAETIVLDANTEDFTTVSIRPRFVWGAGSPVTDGFAAIAAAGQFAWIDGGRHTTDITFVDNAVEGLLLGWQHGKPGQAYFVTDQEPVEFREFMQAVFDIYDVDTPIPDIDLDTAAEVVPVPARWFIGQTCTLRTDKAVNDLGYRPIVSRAAALDTLRRSRHPEATSAGR